MNRLVGGFIMAAVLAACGDDTGGSGGGGSGGGDATSTTGAQTTSDAATSTSSSATSATSGGSGGGGGDGNAYADLFLCEETDFEDDIPLGGPGFDPETGITGEPQDTYLVSTTQIYVRPDKVGEFFSVAGAVLETLNVSEGMLAYGIGSSQACGVSRTLSIWSSEEEMLGFVTSDAHAAAMLQATELGFTGRTAHWEATADELMELDWDVARAKAEEAEAFY